MSQIFREMLKKIGSGIHTGQDLTRFEAALAARMILLEEATPAQIGAFLIAHRIKRPTSEEIAGILDVYDELGPKLQLSSRQTKMPIVFGSPYDGRSRTAPISPMVALVLVAMGQPVIMHGGSVMPTKYGTPLIEIFQGLGLDWTKFSMEKVQEYYDEKGLGFIYLPKHFKEAASLIKIRDEIGKRPPFATAELIWCPYQGLATIAAGFVHPPTEKVFGEALKLKGHQRWIFVKGLEGSCDLPRARTAIISVNDEERLLLHSQDYGLHGQEVGLLPTAELIDSIKALLMGKASPLLEATLWNAGFYLWQTGLSSDLGSGIDLAKNIINGGNLLDVIS